MNGKYQLDPLGWHVTLNCKNQQQLADGTHVTCHGYCNGKEDLTFRLATFAGEKQDAQTWPSNEDLIEAPEIGYGHLGESVEKSDQDEQSK